MPRRLAQQRKTLKWPWMASSASRAISAVAELLVLFLITSRLSWQRVSFWVHVINIVSVYAGELLLQFWYSGEWRRLSNTEFPASAVPDEANDRDGSVESTGDDGRGDNGVGRRRWSCREDVSRPCTRPLQHASCRLVNVATYTVGLVSRNEYRHSRISGHTPW